MINLVKEFPQDMVVVRLVSKWNARLLRGSLRMCVGVCDDEDS